MWSLEKSAEKNWLKDEFARRKPPQNYPHQSEEATTERRQSSSSSEAAAIKMMRSSISSSLNNNHSTNRIEFKSVTSLSVCIMIIIISSNALAEPIAGSKPASALSRQPHFVEPADSSSDDQVQRVSVGRTAKFKCIVNDIGNHKVSFRSTHHC